MHMVKRLIRVVTYQKELPPKNLNSLSIRWLCEVIGQIKYILSPPAEDPLVGTLTQKGQNLQMGVTE